MVRRAARRPGASAGAAELVEHLGADRLEVGAELGEHQRGQPLALADQAEQDVLGADVVVLEGERLDPELVDACAAWFASMEDTYRAIGAIGERPEVPPGADAQTTLLAAFGRTA